MGLLDEYEIDMTQVSEPEYNSKPADDIYEFTLGDVYIQEGSKKQPEKRWIIFKYLLGEDGTQFSELFGLPLDPSNPTPAEVQRLGFYKQRLTSLGVAAENLNTVTSDELVGTTGTLELRTTKGKDGNEYQNIRNFKVAGSGAPTKPAAAKPATAVDNPFAN